MDVRKHREGRTAARTQDADARQPELDMTRDGEIVNDLSSQTPLTPRQILQLQRTIGNQAVLRHLQRRAQTGAGKHHPHEQPVQQPVTADLHKQKAPLRTIQRAVGYEFQTNWGVIYNPGRFKKRRKFNKGEIIRPYQGFNLTADEAGTRLGAELEWVVDPPIPESEPPQTVADIMLRLQNVALQMLDYQNQEIVDLGEATGDSTLKGVEAYPKIKGEDNGRDMKANPQVSGGVRLDQIMQLFEDIKLAYGGEDTDRNRELKNSGMKAVVSMLTNEESGIAIFAYNKVANLTHAGGIPEIGGKPLSRAMKGYVAMALTYLLQGKRGFMNGPLPYVKAFTIMLARTDFGSMFNMLPDEERSYYSANSGAFVNLVLNAVPTLGGEGDLMLTKGIMNVPNEPDKGTWYLPLTRGQWLTGLSQGIDLLSTYHLPAQKGLYESLGALGPKTDKVRGGNNPLNAPVFEFRKVQQQIPVSQWGAFARGVFEYLSSINSGETEEEKEQRLQQEYEEYMRERVDEI